MTDDGAATGDDAATAREHLDGVDDGCGCVEIWEYLSKLRDRATGVTDRASSE